MTTVRDTIKIYWHFAKKRVWSLMAIVLFLAVGAAATTMSPLWYKKFFDIITNLGDNAARADYIRPLFMVLAVVALLEIINWAMWRLIDWLAIRFQTKTIKEMSDHCFAYLHKHSVDFFNNSFAGSLTKRVNRFTRSFESISDRLIYNVVEVIFSILFIVGVLYTRNLWVGAGMTVWILVFLLINFGFAKYKLKWDLKRGEADTATTAILADTIANQINVKLFGGYARENTAFGEATDRLRKLRALTWYMTGAYFALQGFLAIILEVAMFVGATFLWVKGVFTVGDFVLIQSYIISVLLRVWDIGRIIQRSYEDLGDAQEMTEVLNVPHEIKDKPRAKSLIISKGEIVFENVNFSYNATRPILKDFSLEIKPREKVAFMGPSGAGKSTISKLLLRLYDIPSGAIRIDGQDIRKIKLDTLWSNLSLVPQDPILFHRTLAENIRYGCPNATMEEVKQAAAMAHCTEFIERLPEKYDTYVGERGVKLSGGERQRVAIARAILHNAPILVLDEATSSLDSESEKLIQDALDRLIVGKTVIVIAHRLSTIMKMDRIVVLADGRIMEQGTHAELIKNKNGLYNRLWQMQACGFIS